MKFTIRYDPRVTSDGQHIGNGRILVGEKFLHHTHNTQIAVILHEMGHDLGDIMLKDFTAFDLMKAGAFGEKDKHGVYWGIDGETKPDENVAAGYAALIQDPRWLKAKFPKAYAAIKARAKRENMPMTAKEAERLLVDFKRYMRDNSEEMKYLRSLSKH